MPGVGISRLISNPTVSSREAPEESGIKKAAYATYPSRRRLSEVEISNKKLVSRNSESEIWLQSRDQFGDLQK